MGEADLGSLSRLPGGQMEETLVDKVFGVILGWFHLGLIAGVGLSELVVTSSRGTL